MSYDKGSTSQHDESPLLAELSDEDFDWSV